MNKYFIYTKPNRSITLLNNNKTFVLPAINLPYYHAKGLFEEPLIEWSKQLCDPNKIFVDIGAHTGTYSIELADKCAMVHAFEPQRMTYYALCGSVALSSANNVLCHNIGLGSPEQVGKQVLKIVSQDGGGSSLHAKSGIIQTETIEIRTLDSYEMDDIQFIKMDVEDNELHVLKGAVETIKRCNYPKILFESNQQNDELFKFIVDLGYKIIQIEGVNNMFIAST